MVSSCNRPARREDALCRARGPTFPNHYQNLLSGLRHMGIGQEEMTVHGFRAMAKTILDEVLGFRPDFIKHQLAHAVRDSNGRAYNRTAYLPERRKMMQDPPSVSFLFVSRFLRISESNPPHFQDYNHTERFVAADLIVLLLRVGQMR